MVKVIELGKLEASCASLLALLIYMALYPK